MTNPTDAPRLRETVAEAITSVPPQPDFNALALAEADAAIAAMVDALLSDEAYETDPDGRNIYYSPRGAVRAALKAIGATTDCGCTVTDAVDGTVDIDQCSRPDCPRAEGER